MLIAVHFTKKRILMNYIEIENICIRWYLWIMYTVL